MACEVGVGGECEASYGEDHMVGDFEDWPFEGEALGGEEVSGEEE